MDMFIKKLIAVFVFYIGPLFSGFIGDTLIKINDGLFPIKDISLYNTVNCINQQRFTPAYSFVSGVYKYVYANPVRIIFTDSSSMVTALHQQFYLYDMHEWKFTSELQTYDRLLCKNNRYVTIQSIIQCNGIETLYDITVDINHNFYITEHEILVHNALFAAVATAATVTGVAVTAPIIVGCGIAACTFGYIVKKVDIKCVFKGIISLFKSRKNKKRSQCERESQSSNQICGSSQPLRPPDDPNKFKKEHPYGKYEDAPYHRNHQSGRKSPRPTDGQGLLIILMKLVEVVIVE
jgi:hypothetical protein